MAEVAKRHPTYIARTLIALSVCIQQFPVDFDMSKLDLHPTPDARVEKYLSTIQALVIADDDLACSFEGLESLLLLGLYHVNSGNLRRAWFTCRRALNVGQLMGIHRRPTVDSPSPIPNGYVTWHHIIKADRYIGLLLGLPLGSADDTFGPEETFDNPEMDKDLLYMRHLSILAGRLMERNQSDPTTAFAATQDIDEKLERLAQQMPESFWHVPASVGCGVTDESMETCSRLMGHFWYFQVVAFLHLPFMLRASTERRYEYSKISCLRASRELIYRYICLRNFEGGAFCCKVIDFSAFTAAVTIFLSLIEPSQRMETPAEVQQRKDDHALVRAVAEVMEKLKASGKDLLASQSAEVIRTLLAVENSSTHSGNLRLTIPYFGTINITRAAQPPNSLSNDLGIPVRVQHQPAARDSHGITDHQWTANSLAPPTMYHTPMVSFTSSQFNPVMGGEQYTSFESWQPQQEVEDLYFDGMLNMDVEGNWVF